VLDRAEAAAGCRATELRLTGGLAAAPAVARLKAAALGRPVLAFAAREGALLGAAGLTWTALGRYADLVAAQTVLAAAPRRVEASAAEHALADRRFARWRAEVARACGSGAS
jgi:sugar (pentulose or hexulose) kinase